VQNSVESNKILEPVPAGESNVVFSKLLRQNHNNSAQDLGMRRFR